MSSGFRRDCGTDEESCIRFSTSVPSQRLQAATTVVGYPEMTVCPHNADRGRRKHLTDGDGSSGEPGLEQENGQKKKNAIKTIDKKGNSRGVEWIIWN